MVFSSITTGRAWTRRRSWALSGQKRNCPRCPGDGRPLTKPRTILAPPAPAAFKARDQVTQVGLPRLVAPPADQRAESSCADRVNITPRGAATARRGHRGAMVPTNGERAHAAPGRAAALRRPRPRISGRNLRAPIASISPTWRATARRGSRTCGTARCLYLAPRPTVPA
jgi:hypothetical protein